MGVWGNNWNNSYAGKNDGYTSKQIITYTNTSETMECIKSITMPMGTGHGTYTSGSSVTGDGSPITFYVYVDGNQNSSSTPIVVSSVVGVASGDAGTYPPKGDMVPHTVEFTTDVFVDPQSTVCFTFASNSTQTNSQVFVWDNTKISGVVNVVCRIWKYNSASKAWEEGPMLKRFNNGSWEDISTFYIHELGTWDIQ